MFICQMDASFYSLHLAYKHAQISKTKQIKQKKETKVEVKQLALQYVMEIAKQKENNSFANLHFGLVEIMAIMP